VTSNNNSTYQENQKNSQILDADIPGMIDQELGAGDYRFVTPVGNEKSLYVSVANTHGGTPPCNSPMMAQTALALQKQSAGMLMLEDFQSTNSSSSAWFEYWMNCS